MSLLALDVSIQHRWNSLADLQQSWDSLSVYFMIWALSNTLRMTFW
jgi:hypothetical protein